MTNKNPILLTLEDEFSFGKHKSEQVEDVIYDDPSYIAWVIEKEIVKFNATAMALIEKRKIV